jgi:DNA topoisomerase-3
MEDSAIRAGFANLKDGAEYDNLCAAAKCREQADWAVGISATRLFSVLYGTSTLNVGRVLSPTLAMLVRRETEIASFVTNPFDTVEIDCGGVKAISERIDNPSRAGNREYAESMRASVDGQTATVAAVKREQKSVSAPKLYDLTTLQRDANRLLGYTAQQTLDYAQSLYEKKLLSYPRTDSRHITADMSGTVAELLTDIDFTPNIGALIGAVSDHHALLPTAQSLTADLSALPSGERDILNLVSVRLKCAAAPAHRYESVTAVFDCCDPSRAGRLAFTAKGKTVLDNGWKAIDGAFRASLKNKSDDDGETDTALPPLAEGQTFDNVTATLKEGATSPPKHFTEDTLLSSMENAGAEDMPDEAERCGLATPATRAATIEKLVKSGFVERSKKNLLPTDKGKNLIAVLPAALTSAKLTAEWENKLLEIQRGALSESEFMDGIAAFIKAIVLDNNKPKPEFAALFPNTRKTSESLGKCPRCGGDVTEWDKGFSCVNNKVCGFKLWKDSKFWTAKKKPDSGSPVLTAAIVTHLLKDGKVALKDLYSEKTGKSYGATVLFDDEGADKIGQYVNFRMEFVNNNGRAKK